MKCFFSRSGVSSVPPVVVQRGRNSFKANLQPYSNTTRASQSVPQVKATTGELDLNTFHQDFWTPELPLAFHSFHGFPAARKWFTHEPHSPQVSFTEYVGKHDHVILSYEFMSSSASKGAALDPQLKNLQDFHEWLRYSKQDEKRHLHQIVEYLIQSMKEAGSQFLQFDAPLSLLIGACQFNHTRNNPSDRIKMLYIAQSNLDHLPAALSQDLPMPRLVKDAGRGDIYDSSIWMGLEPTYTPLHCDPNPNLFCQVLGSKTIRLMRPNPGSDLLARVRQKLGSTGSSRLRGVEMMEGPERELLHHAVWIDQSRPEDIQQASVGPGDALFIPKGWWHSVVSAGDQSDLNVSVNWWFR